jgi:hypothetical protein
MTIINDTEYLTFTESIRDVDPEDSPWISLDEPGINEAFYGRGAVSISHATGGYIFYCDDCISWAVVDTEWEARLMRDAHRQALIDQDDDQPDSAEDIEEFGSEPYEPECPTVIVNLNDRLVRYAFV